MKKAILLLILLTAKVGLAQTYKIEAVVPATATNDDMGMRVELKKTDGFFNTGLRVVNRSTSYSYATRSSHAGGGVGVYGNSITGVGVFGATGFQDVDIVYAGSGASGQPSAVFGYANTSQIGVEGNSQTGIGGYFSSVSGYSLVTKVGNVGIGTGTPKYPLAFPDAVGDKISFYYGNTSNTTNHYGIGVQAAQFQLFTPTSNDDIVLGYGRSASFTENVRFKGNGYVGIGISTPDQILDVDGRMRIRHSGNTAGIWMSNASNGLAVGDGAFFGINNAIAGSETAGIWIGSGWRFYVDRVGNTTIGGGVSVGGGDVINKIIKTTINKSVSSVAINGATTVSFTISGANIGDVVVCNAQNPMTTLTISNVYVSAANTVSVTFINTASYVNSLPATDFHFIVFK